MSTPVKSIPRNYDYSTPYRLHSPDDRLAADMLRTRLKAAQASAQHLSDQLTLAKRKTERVDELEDKLEMILKHNTNLLEEVSELSSLIGQKNMKIEVLQNKLQRVHDSQSALEMTIGRESHSLRAELEKVHQEYRLEISRLNQEIRFTQKDMQELERSKSMELAALRKRMQCEWEESNALSKRHEQGNRQDYQLKLTRLKEALSMKDFQLEELGKKHLGDINRLSEEIEYLNDLLRHREQIKEGEMRQLINKYEDELALLQHQEVAKHQVVLTSHSMEVDKLRLQVGTQLKQIDALHNRLLALNHASDQDSKRTEIEKQRLRIELQQTVARGLEAIEEERSKERDLARLELQGLEQTNLQKETLLLSENQKLRDLLQHKCTELAKAHRQMASQKEGHLAQAAERDRAIDELNERLKRILLTEEIEREALIVRQAQLTEADLKVLLEQLQHQGEDLTEQLRNRQRQLEDKGSRLEQALKDKMQLRKAYELLLGQVRGEKDQLLRQIEGMNSEMKESVVMIQSRMDVQAGSLKRDVQAQKKTNTNIEDQRRKLMDVIQSKDKEIEMLNEKFARAKANFEEERRLLESRLTQKQGLFAELDALKNQEISNLKQDIQKNGVLAKEDLQSQMLQLTEKQQLLDQAIKRGEELEKAFLIEQREKEKALQRVSEAQDSMTKRVRQFEQVNHQALNSQSELLNQSKIMKVQNENKLKEYYQNSISRLERDLADLRAVNEQKEEQIGHWKEKCHQHELKMGKVLASSQKLKNIEQKVLNLGIDKSLLKNMQDLLKPRTY